MLEARLTVYPIWIKSKDHTWMLMDSSGVSIVGSPVNGLANKAPSSVIWVNALRDTSWNPPLSWKSNLWIDGE